MTQNKITALLNGEIEIGQFIPPRLPHRVEGHPKTNVVAADSLEIMFLAMPPKPSLDKKEVRQVVVCRAID